MTARTEEKQREERFTNVVGAGTFLNGSKWKLIENGNIRNEN